MKQQQPAKKAQPQEFWKGCKDAISQTGENPRAIPEQEFLDFLEQINSKNHQVLLPEDKEYKACIVKDGLLQTTNVDQMQMWYKQTHLDAKVYELFYSKASPKTRALLRLTKPYPNLSVFGYRCVYLLNSMGLSEH